MSLTDLIHLAKAIETNARQAEVDAMRSNEKYWMAHSDLRLMSLSPEMQKKIIFILKVLRNKRWKPVVVYGRRTMAQQQEKVRDGYSQTVHSLHVMGEHQQKAGHGREPRHSAAQGVVSQYGAYLIRGEAADIVDARWGWLGPCSNLRHPFWADLGLTAKEAGLVWGGDWRPKPDVAHVEMQKYETAQDTRFPVS